jgi:signal transduction histidine kinase
MLVEALLRNAKSAAEQANKATSEFLALVSHEIRTPLNSLVGFSRMALSTTDPAKLAQYHAILEESSRSLMELVNDILDMSKIEAGRHPRTETIPPVQTIPAGWPEYLPQIRRHRSRTGHCTAWS